MLSRCLYSHLQQFSYSSLFCWINLQFLEVYNIFCYANIFSLGCYRKKCLKYWFSIYRVILLILHLCLNTWLSFEKMYSYSVKICLEKLLNNLRYLWITCTAWKVRLFSVKQSTTPYLPTHTNFHMKLIFIFKSQHILKIQPFTHKMPWKNATFR